MIQKVNTFLNNECSSYVLRAQLLTCFNFGTHYTHCLFGQTKLLFLLKHLDVKYNEKFNYVD